MASEKKTTVIHSGTALSEYNALMTEWYGDDAATKQHAEHESTEKDAIMERMQWMKDNGIDLGESQGMFDNVFAAMTGIGDAGDFKLNGGIELVGASTRMGDTEMQAMGNVMMQLDKLRESGTISLEDYQAYMTDLFSGDTMGDLLNGALGNNFQTLVQDICNTDARGVEGQYENAEGIKSHTVIRDTDDYLASYAERHELEEPPSYDGPTCESMLYDMLLEHGGEVGNDVAGRLDEYISSGLAQGTTKSTLMITAINDALESGDKLLLMKFMDPATYDNMYYSDALVNSLTDLDNTVRGAYTDDKAFDSTPSAGDTENTGSDTIETDYSDRDFDYALSNDKIELVLAGGPDAKYEKMRGAAIDIWNGVYGNGADRRPALAAAGFTDAEIDDLYTMVNHTQDNMYGMTEELYDSLFSERDGSLADQRDAYAEIVSSVMTYEGPGDLLAKNGHHDAFKGDAGIEAATKAYMNAATYLSEHQDEAGKGFETRGDLGEAAKEEVTANLASYMATGVAAFEGADKNADADKAASKEAEEKVAEETGFQFGD